MSRWRVRLSSGAVKVFKRADRPTQERLAQKIDALAVDPFAASKPLVNSVMRSARVGDLRLLLTIDRGEVTVEVVTIEPRGQDLLGRHQRSAPCAGWPIVSRERSRADHPSYRYRWRERACLRADASPGLSFRTAYPWPEKSPPVQPWSTIHLSKP